MFLVVKIYLILCVRPCSITVFHMMCALGTPFEGVHYVMQYTKFQTNPCGTY
jgi:hypothetical protein